MERLGREAFHGRMSLDTAPALQPTLVLGAGGKTGRQQEDG
ncbi:MAG TPA: hypothetical protein VFX21_03970 [Acidimicrobiia bacterium]|nr:hypothetical protein [Acidimicrobiia bacterium]